MQQVKNQMNRTIENQVHKILYQVLAGIKKENEMEETLVALLTEAEIEALSKRLAIAIFLDNGQSYDHIKNTLKVSSATIATVANNVDKKGLQLAIARVKAEQWADMWSIRITRALEKLIKA